MLIRGGRFMTAAVAVVTLGLLAAACTSDSEGSAPERESGIGSEAAVGRGEPIGSDLLTAIEETIAVPRMSFELNVTSTLPGATSPIVARRTGSFDDLTFSGTGTRSFETDDQTLAQLWGDDPFEFIVVDNNLWMRNPLAEPAEWNGFNALEFAKFAGGNPLGSVDVDGYLELIVAATDTVSDIQERQDGTRTWVLSVRADDLLPLIAAAGPAQRLAEVGAADSGLIAEIRVEQDAQGLISSVDGNVDQWWANALTLADPSADATDPPTMQLELRLMATESGGLDLAAPCTVPSRSVENGLRILACGPESTELVLVWLDPGIGPQSVEAVREVLATASEVERFDYLDEEATYEQFVLYFADEPEVIDLVSPDQLPTSFEIWTSNAAALAELVVGLDGVDEVERAPLGRP